MLSRSAKTLAKAKFRHMDIDEDEDEYSVVQGGDDLENSVASEGEEHSSDEDSDGDFGPGSSEKRPSKRAKISFDLSPTTQKTVADSQKPAIKSTPRPRKSLSLLPTMPLDVLFEIFGNLNPRDIVSLARTNHLFRDTLLSRNATTVWRAARNRFDAPDPPSDLSEPQWAALLFGNTCQLCDAKNVQKVDFLLKRRICAGCRKVNLCTESKLKLRFPGFDKSILDLILHTNANGSPRTLPNRRRYFWTNDVEKMIHTMAAYKHNVSMGRKDARKIMNAYKEEQIRLAEASRSTALEYSEWLDKSHSERRMDKDAAITKRRKEVCRRLEELGYSNRDITFVSYDSECSSPAQLTERIWNRIRPILERRLAELENLRVAKQLALLKNSRRNVVDRLYDTYKRSLAPLQWRYLPRTLDVCLLEPFAQVIDCPSDVAVTANSFEQPMKMLPGMLSLILDDKKTKYLNMLSAALDTDLPSKDGEILDSTEPPAVATSSSPYQEAHNPLELATSVFECRQTSYYHSTCILVGAEDLLTHHCDSETAGITDTYNSYNTSLTRTSGVKICAVGSETSKSLVQLAGLDPETALISEMDAKDIIFTHPREPEQGSNDRWFLRGFNWRSAILHDLQEHYKQKSPAHWRIVSEDDRENATPTHDTRRLRQWTCGHCSVFMTALRARDEVLQHLAAEHMITQPKEPDDLFLFDRTDFGLGQKITYSLFPRHLDFSCRAMALRSYSP